MFLFLLVQRFSKNCVYSLPVIQFHCTLSLRDLLRSFIILWALPSLSQASYLLPDTCIFKLCLFTFLVSLFTTALFSLYSAYFFFFFRNNILRGQFLLSLTIFQMSLFQTLEYFYTFYILHKSFFRRFCNNFFLNCPILYLYFCLVVSL
jgi:hypothetical protein